MLRMLIEQKTPFYGHPKIDREITRSPSLSQVLGKEIYLEHSLLCKFCFSHSLRLAIDKQDMKLYFPILGLLSRGALQDLILCCTFWICIKLELAVRKPASVLMVVLTLITCMCGMCRLLFMRKDSASCGIKQLHVLSCLHLPSLQHGEGNSCLM